MISSNCHLRNWADFCLHRLIRSRIFDDLIADARSLFRRYRLVRPRPDCETVNTRSTLTGLCIVKTILRDFTSPMSIKGLNAIVDYGTYTTETFRYSSLQTGYNADGEIAAKYLFVFPNLMFNFYPWGISVNIVRPVSPSKTVVEFLNYVRDESLIEASARSGPARRRNGRRSCCRKRAKRDPIAILFARPIFADT